MLLREDGDGLRIPRPLASRPWESGEGCPDCGALGSGTPSLSSLFHLVYPRCFRCRIQIHRFCVVLMMRSYLFLALSENIM